MSGVSGNRPRALDRLPKQSGQTKIVGLARVTYIDDTRAVCSCGSTFSHAREKVLEDRIDTHLHRRHAGRGIRL